MSVQGFMQFILDCALHPRQAARSAHGIYRPWTIVALISAACALVTGVGVWIRLRTETDSDLFSYTSPGNAGSEALIEMAITFLLLIISYPLGLFIWKKVLGFKAQTIGVQAAMVASFGLALVLSPIIEILSTGLWATDTVEESLPWLAYFAVSFVLTTYYFSESLAISYASALFKNFLATGLMLFVLVLPFAAVVAVPIIAGSALVAATGIEQ